MQIIKTMKTKVKFTLPAQVAGEAKGGKLLGEFNNWNQAEAIDLTLNEDGSLYAEVELPNGKTYQYRYLLHDGRWVNDHSKTVAAEAYGSTVENSLVMVPASKAASAESTKSAVKKAAPKKAVAKKVTETPAAPKKAEVKKATEAPAAAKKAPAKKATETAAPAKKASAKK